MCIRDRLGLVPHPDLGEFGHVFYDLDDLTICDANTLKGGAPERLDLIDAEGRRWAVRSVVRVGRAGGFLPWVLGALVGWNRYRLDYELEAAQPVTLDYVKDRVGAVEQVFGNLDDYTEEHEAETADRLAKIRRAKTISRVAKLTEWGGF